MKVEVRIEKVKKATGDIVAPSVYDYKGKRKVLLTIDEMKVYDIYDKTIPPSVDVQFKGPNPVVKYTYFAESDGTAIRGVTAEDENKRRVVEEFWKGHPLFVVNGRPHSNTKDAVFNIIDMPALINERSDEWEMARKIMNLLAESDTSTLLDMHYWYLQTPVGKSRKELILDILSLKGGLAYGVDRMKEFLASWEGPASADREVRVNAQKAISLGIITKREDGTRTNYYYGSEFVGTEISDIIAYFKRDEKVYKDFVVRKIAEVEPVKKTETDSAQMDRFSTSLPQEEINILVDRIKELKKEGLVDASYRFTNKSVEQLKTTIAEAEAKKGS
jgi:hypothetical protein